MVFCNFTVTGSQDGMLKLQNNPRGRSRVVQCSVVKYTTVQLSSVLCSAVLFFVVQCKVVLCCAVQTCAMHCNAVLCSCAMQS